MGLVGNQTSVSTAEHLLWLWEKAEITEGVEWVKLINHQIFNVKADKEMKKDNNKKLYIFTLDLYMLMQTVWIMVPGMCDWLST